MDKAKADRINEIISTLNPLRLEARQLEIELEVLTGIHGEATPIKDLHFSTRVHNALHRGGYRYIEQLIAIDDWKKLYMLRNFGEKACDEVVRNIAEWQAVRTKP